MLVADREGIAVLDPRWAAPLLHGVGALAAKRLKFGRRMRAAVTIPAPRIVVAEPARRAA